MLQSIRDNLQGTMAKVIIAIIIVPFAIFGIEGLISIGGGDDAVATVNGEEIPAATLARAVDAQKRRLAARGAASPDMLDERNLRGPILEQLIAQSLLLQYADRLGLNVSDAFLDRVIVSAPEFRENDRFSPDRYRVLLANQGLTPAYFKNEVLRREMLIGQLQRGIVGSDFVTAGELSRVARLVDQQRGFAYALVPADRSAGELDVDDAEVEAYYAENVEKFMRQPQVRLAYVELKSAEFTPEVSEQAVRAEYERQSSLAQARDQLEAAHILVAVTESTSDAEARQRAQALHAQLQSGEADFAVLAEAESDDRGSAADGGAVGTTTGDTFPPAFEAALAELEEGEIAAPVRTEAGWHVIKLLSRQAGERPSFEERRDAIGRELAQSQARPELLKTVERLRDLAFNADDVAEPASALGLERKTTDWLASDNDHPLFGDPRLMQAAFSEEVLEQGHNSDVVELGPDHFVLLGVVEHRAAAPRPLEEVRDTIQRQLMEKQRAEAARRAAETLAEQVRAGDSLAALAAQQGYQHAQVEPLSRTTDGPLPGLTAGAFTLPRPAEGETSVGAIPLQNGDFAVIELQTVEDGQAEGWAGAEKAGWRQQLAGSEGQAAFAALLEHLRASAEIER